MGTDSAGHEDRGQGEERPVGAQVGPDAAPDNRPHRNALTQGKDDAGEEPVEQEQGGGGRRGGRQPRQGGAARPQQGLAVAGHLEHQGTGPEGQGHLAGVEQRLPQRLAMGELAEGAGRRHGRQGPAGGGDQDQCQAERPRRRDLAAPFEAQALEGSQLGRQEEGGEQPELGGPFAGELPQARPEDGGDEDAEAQQGDPGDVQFEGTVSRAGHGSPLGAGKGATRIAG